MNSRISPPGPLSEIVPAYARYLQVSADEVHEAGAVHTRKGFHLLEKLCPLFTIKDAEHFDGVQLPRLDVLQGANKYIRSAIYTDYIVLKGLRKLKKSKRNTFAA